MQHLNSITFSVKSLYESVFKCTWQHTRWSMCTNIQQNKNWPNSSSWHGHIQHHLQLLAISQLVGSEARVEEICSMRRGCATILHSKTLLPLCEATVFLRLAQITLANRSLVFLNKMSWQGVMGKKTTRGETRKTSANDSSMFPRSPQVPNCDGLYPVFTTYTPL